MRILQIVTRSEPGGAQSVILSLSEGLAARGHEVAIAAGLEGEGQAFAGMRKDILQIPLRAMRRSVSFVNDIPAVFEIARLYRSFRPDCVHVHTSKAAMAGRLAPGVRRHRIVYTMHGFDQLRVANPRYLSLDRMLAPLCGKIVAVSRRDRMLMEREGYPARLLAQVAVGSQDVRDLAAPWDRAAERLTDLRRGGLPVVLMVARNAAPKRVDLLKELALRLAGQAVFVWIGSDAPGGTGMESHRGPGSGSGTQAMNAGQGEVVEPGSLAGAAAYWRFADIALLLSDHEGLPVSLVEAMSAGLPCVASAVGGIPELFSKGGGIPVENEIGAIVSALKPLLKDSGTRSAMGAEARKVWEADFRIDRMVDAYESIYRELLSGVRP